MLNKLGGYQIFYLDYQLILESNDKLFCVLYKSHSRCNLSRQTMNIWYLNCLVVYRLTIRLYLREITQNYLTLKRMMDLFYIFHLQIFLVSNQFEPFGGISVYGLIDISFFQRRFHLS